MFDKLDMHWAAGLGCRVTDLSQDRTVVVRHGAELSNYAGLFALKRNASSILSVPSANYEIALARCKGHPPHAVFDVSFLQKIAPPQWNVVIGPAWLGSADLTTFRVADSRGARMLTHGDSTALRGLEAACDPVDWKHSAIDPDHDLLFGCFRGPLLVGAGACLREGAGMLGIGILTHPAFRGQGYGRAVVSAMTAYGLTHQYVMRYRTLQANIPSVRCARALGYQDYGLTIAIRAAA